MAKNHKILLDRERNLRLDLNAMSEFEELTGTSLFTIGEKMSEAKNIRALLYCTMKSAGEEITLNELGSLIDFENINIISEALGKLMNASYGESDSKTEKK
jgi:hypothetical protein